MIRAAYVWAVVAGLGLPWVGGSAQAADPSTLTVINVTPHDVDAFTQGFLFNDGVFYESTGRWGESSVRRVDIATGVVAQQFDIDQQHFGEGLALVGDRLIQLTWQSEVALVYDQDTLQPIDEIPYSGQGWGLCFDGVNLVMSDGSARLAFRDPDTFELVREVDVTDNGVPATGLNELECVGDQVYANVWRSDWILRIDGQTGEVLAAIDGAGLLTDAQAAAAGVLNGIAYDPETEHFFLTGKNWPSVFEVNLAETDAGSETTQDSSDGPLDPDVDESDTGCACRTSSSPVAPTLAAWWLALGALVGPRRRRLRRARSSRQRALRRRRPECVV